MECYILCMDKKSLPAGRQGFTIIELLVVISIIALFSVVVFAIIFSARDDAKAVAAKKQLSEMRSQGALFYSRNGLTYNSGNTIDHLNDECVSIETGGESILHEDAPENVVRLLDGIKLSLGPTLSPSVRCFVSSQTFAFSAQISDSGKTFCIDNLEKPSENKVAGPNGCE